MQEKDDDQVRKKTQLFNNIFSSMAVYFDRIIYAHNELYSTKNKVTVSFKILSRIWRRLQVLYSEY